MGPRPAAGPAARSAAPVRTTAARGRRRRTDRGMASLDLQGSRVPRDRNRRGGAEARTIAPVPAALRTLAPPIALLATLAVPPVAGAARIYDVPGVGGRGVAVAAAARLDNGGAGVSAPVRHRLVAVRPLASGEPDRRHGGGGGRPRRGGGGTGGAGWPPPPPAPASPPGACPPRASRPAATAGSTASCRSRRSPAPPPWPSIRGRGRPGSAARPASGARWWR